MRKSLALLLVLIFLTASCVISAKPEFSSAATTEDTWAAKAPMHEARSGLGVAAVNGKIYAIGGVNSSGSQPNGIGEAVYTGRTPAVVTGANEEYDPATDTWIYKSAMPTPRALFATAVYQNRIYCIGGKTGSGYTGVVEVYDPATDKWENKIAMPTPRAFLQANVVDGKIYLIGGMSLNPDDPYPTLNEVYDPATDSWSKGEPMPDMTVFGYASAVFDSKIYINVGLLVYDAETGTWSHFAPPYSMGEGFTAAAATIGLMAPVRIYFFSTGEVGVYDPANDSWSVGAGVPTSRYLFNVAVVNDRFYVIGGHTYWWVTGVYVPLAVNEEYTPFGYGTVPPVISVVSLADHAYNESNVPLIFNVDKPVNWMGYSLDGQDNITITGNTTLSGLSNGLHNVTVYARDKFENTGASETISFSVEAPFPVIPVAVASAAAAAVASVGLLVYFKKRKR
jgi:N-acetylneuraminic acid mutarotase